jgi:hypothetical protein
MIHIANHPGMNKRPVEAGVVRRQSHPIIAKLPIYYYDDDDHHHHHHHHHHYYTTTLLLLLLLLLQNHNCINIPASYSKGPRFKARLGDRVSGLMLFVFFRPSRQMPR